MTLNNGDFDYKMILAEPKYNIINIRPQNNDCYKQYYYTELPSSGTVFSNINSGLYFQVFNGLVSSSYFGVKKIVPIGLSGFTTVYMSAKWTNMTGTTSKIGLMTPAYGIGIGYNNGTFGIFEHSGGTPDQYTLTLSGGGTPGTVSIGMPGMSANVFLSTGTLTQAVVNIARNTVNSSYLPTYNGTGIRFINESEINLSAPTFSAGATTLTGSIAYTVTGVAPTTTWTTNFFFNPLGNSDYTQDYAMTIAPGGTVVYFGVFSKSAQAYRLFCTYVPTGIIPPALSLRAWIRGGLTGTGGWMYISSVSAVTGPYYDGTSRRITNNSTIINGPSDLAITGIGPFRLASSLFNTKIFGLTYGISPSTTGGQSLVYFTLGYPASTRSIMYKVMGIGINSRATNTIGVVSLVPNPVGTYLTLDNVTSLKTASSGSYIAYSYGSGAMNASYNAFNTSVDMQFRGGSSATWTMANDDSWPVLSYMQDLFIQIRIASYVTGSETRVNIIFAEIGQ